MKPFVPIYANIAVLALSLAAFSNDTDQSAPIVYKHAYAFLDDPKYPADFKHFDYVNPNAPKGGRMRISASGQWSNFNPFSVPIGHMVLGVDPERPDWNLLYDALLNRSADEPSAMYGLLAEGIAVAEDGAWIAFKIRDHARWHDGKPITIEDVYFSFILFTKDASPTVRSPLKVIESFEIIGPHEIRFHIREEARGDPLLPMLIGSKPILPKHYWETRDISKTTVEAPLGSGPYRIGKFRVGRWIRWERVDDYWGKDLPIMRGRYNFDEIKWDYFRDHQVQAESVRGDIVDVNIDDNPRSWNTAYDFPAFHAGAFRKHFLPVKQPSGLWASVAWNLDQPRFQDVRVREALWIVSDFKWLNWRMYDGYGLANSYFHGSILASRGLPNMRELKYLEPIRDLVPPRVFTEAFQRPPNGGSGWHRENFIKASALLKEAGWIHEKGRLIHGKTGEPFHIRFVVVPRGLAAALIPYLRNLERLGITATMTSPETSNWVFRMRSGDFDGGNMWFVPADFTPTSHVIRFASASADHEYGTNYPNIRNPAIDYLITAIKSARSYEDYTAAIRAWDRVMLWNFYLVPGMSRTRIGIAHWDRYNWPEQKDLIREVHYETWWWDENRAARVAEHLGN